MSSSANPLAGKRAAPSALVNLPVLLSNYYSLHPDMGEATHRVAFGTSGHRGNANAHSFNEWHVLAITQAICDYRNGKGFTGPLFLGIDTHALSEPAWHSALEVLAANEVVTMLAEGSPYAPTPAVSHAILAHNRVNRTALADGIVITPSHNPPDNGGFKYNMPNGGPADSDVTGWIEQRANAYFEKHLDGVRRMTFDKALKAGTTRRYDYLDNYVSDLPNIIDLAAIAGAGVRIGVDPLGGAGVHYWPAIAERYKLNLEVVNTEVDPTFRFVPQDWDGQIRMDPSSPYAMSELIALKERFDVALACDTDHDRHGIIAGSTGLLPANDYLAVAVHYLFSHRPAWRADAAVGKTLVSSQMINRVAGHLGRKLLEMPVGFKWFVDGLYDGSIAFGCEESAGASFVRFDGQPWSTDKDGITAALLAAEMTARTGNDPGRIYQELTQQLGAPRNGRIEAAATPQQKARLSRLSPDDVSSTELAGEPIREVRTTAPANGKPFGGLKIVTDNGWFAARPSGTENIYKIYGESFRDQAHLDRIFAEAQEIVTRALKAG
ncbi:MULTISPECIES: phosphoglucomutase (alpha-D-glucose-1,6-bisphosphate-dependent) [unclassified Herbaspirillum]|uniref:phosphoglucomutase (alpha-D-glucose-1,6-bisphosphate-dependent) n=1 Tax=unclassified Herbaspirillum TaxID=2624150 RepID=UPI001151767C|nr:MULTISPECIES: phosphoglucomutase (alpha-D-glucose-1,6-bisphosphate-dependent) [unclassified Herbaspirillum]MBB5393428.1 phosphoglucomutase [Herbaspirillum sp. SJZ102]TQK03824.1 phosphoglucomutase [Herbaspirillum sp. SJZ130]TQK08556.1 phosphoglucomutase [Herbaspirillum sp. SJZ106]